MKKHILFLFFFISFSAFAQEDTAEYSLQTPKKTLWTHFYYLQNEHFEPELAAKTLYAPGMSEEERIERAIQLKKIFDGRGYRVDVAGAPDVPDYKNEQGKAVYIADDRLSEVYLTKVHGKWMYSNETVRKIPALYEGTYHWITEEVLKILPKAGNREILGLYLWQIMGILILCVLAFLLHKIFTWFFEVIIIRVIIRMGKRHIASKFIRPVAKPLSLFLVTGILLILVPALQLPITSASVVLLILKGLLPLLATIVFYKLVDLIGAYLERLAARTESTLDDQLIPLVKKALKVFVLITGTLFVLENLEFDITALLAGISIGGLALALAAQDTLKNLFGSFMIFLDRPFQIGDWIISEKIDGSVEEVGFRSTRIRTFHNSVISVPNGKVADQTIDNMGMRKYRRFKTNLAVTYDTPPDLLEVFIQGLEKIVLEHPATRKDYYNIYLNDMGSHSLDILFYIFFEVGSWPEELKGRQEVILSIIRLAERLNVRFAFPTQTLHMETFPEKQGLTPEYKESKVEMENKMKGFFRAE